MLDDIKAAEAALEAHRTAARLEEGHGDETGLYHLLASLLAFCHARGIDFDETLARVRLDDYLN